MTTNPNTPTIDPAKFADVSGARPQRGGNYVRPGHFLARVDRFRLGTKHNGEEYLAIELTVLKVFENGPVGFDYDRKAPVAPLAVGEAVAEIIKKSNVAYAPRAKAFIMAADGLEETDFAHFGPTGVVEGTIEKVPGTLMATALGPTQPMSGAILEIRADQVTNKAASAKPREALVMKDTYVRVSYIRALTEDEAKTQLDAAVFDQFCKE